MDYEVCFATDIQTVLLHSPYHQIPNETVKVIRKGRTCSVRYMHAEYGTVTLLCHAVGYILHADLFHRYNYYEHISKCWN